MPVNLSRPCRVMQGESEEDMRANDLIRELQERIEIYGDLEVTIRIEDDDMDLLSVYGDEDAERIIVSNYPDIG